jgi:hypothetical protein
VRASGADRASNLLQTSRYRRRSDAGIYAPAIFFDGLIQKTVLDVFFLCLALWILSGLVVNPHRRGWVWLGVAMGGLALTRENALVLVAIVLIWSLNRRHRPLTERATAAALCVLGVGLVPPGRAAQQRGRRRILSHDVPVRPELLHRKQPARRWDIYAASLRPRGA